MKIASILFATVLPLCAQEFKLPEGIDRLAGKATQTVDVTLDGAMLHLAARFMTDRDQDQAKVKKLLDGLQSVTVKSFEFASDGQYNQADVEALRTQAKAPGWMRVVGVSSKRDGDNVDVYFKDGGNGNLGGVLLLCAGARKLTIVSVIGSIDPTQLGDLGGHFGIPALAVDLHLGGRKGDQ